MKHLHTHGLIDGLFGTHAKRLARCEQKQRTKTLATALHGVTYRIIKTGQARRQRQFFHSVLNERLERGCFYHKGDSKRNVNTNEIVKTKDFDKPIEKLKNGNYNMKSGIVYLCFSTDFLIEEADEWRNDCWNMNTFIFGIFFIDIKVDFCDKYF